MVSLELIQEIGERLGVVGFQQADEARLLAQQLSRGENFLAGTGDRALGADPGLTDARQRLVIRQLPEQPDRHQRHARDG